MKKMKKIVSLVLAFVMVLAMATTAFADENVGSITVKNAEVGQEYSLYRILKIESYNPGTDAPDDGIFVYKATEEWDEFINMAGIKDTYVSIDASGYVTWVNGADPAAFAQKAVDWAKGKDRGNVKRFDPLKSQKATTAVEGATETELTFTNLELGYYLIDSSLGTLCALDSTEPHVDVREKNEHPTIVKEVKEGSDFGETNDTDIGNTVYYKAIITPQKGAENYVMHDHMDAGLTLYLGDDDYNPFKVKYINSGNKEEDMPVDKYEIITDPTDDCTFEVVFTDNEFMNRLGYDEKQIIVYYEAVLNENAVVGADGNVNDVYLEYGDHNETIHDQTKTYTYEFDLIKTDGAGKLIDGAIFELYNDHPDARESAFRFVKTAAGVYRVATAEELENPDIEKTTEIVVTNGQVKVSGLDGNWHYWLVEKDAPDGYNLLSGPQEIKLERTNELATVTDGVYVEGGFRVINQAGTELPSTGGMGTTIFYVIGGLMAIGAVILLITKKRMSNIEF